MLLNVDGRRIVWNVLQTAVKFDPIVIGMDKLLANDNPLSSDIQAYKIPKYYLFTYSCIVYNAGCGFGMGFSM